MPTSETKTAPGTLTEVADSLQAWTDLANAAASDGSDATCGVTSVSQVSNRVRFTNWGFDIPLNTTIDSVSWTIEAASEDGAKTINDKLAFLFDGTNTIGSDQATGVVFPASDTDRTYTQQAKGLGLTPEIINSAAFGCQWQMEHNAGVGTVTGTVDAIKTMIVNYTEGQGRQYRQMRTNRS